MKKACPYCNKIHEINYVCPKRPLRRQHNADNAIVKFRNSKPWQHKREHIRIRDRNMCRLCAIGYGGAPIEYVHDVSVHHIEPLSTAWELRLDDDNLICLCDRHHELAECGKIPADLLKKIAKSEFFARLP